MGDMKRKLLAISLVVLGAMVLSWQIVMDRRVARPQFEIKANPNVDADKIRFWYPATEPTLSWQYGGEPHSGLMRDKSGQIFLVCKGQILGKWDGPWPITREDLERRKPCEGKP